MSEPSGQLPEAYEREFPALSATGWRERKAAAEALRDLVSAGIGGKAAITSLAERLLEGLTSPDNVDGRAACHEVLVAIGRPAIPPLLARLDAPAPARRRLIDLLGEIGTEEHVPALLEILRDPGADPNLRASAAAGLGRLGGEDARLALLDLLEDTSDMLRVHGLDALRTSEMPVPAERIEPLVARRFTRKAAAAVLGHTADPAALVHVVPLLDDPMAGVRATSVVALERLDTDLEETGKPGLVGAALRRISGETRARVRALIEHRDREVRAAAIRVCAMASDPDALGAVIEVMDDPLIQERAIALVRALGPAAVGALLSTAESVAAEHREFFLRLVAALGPGHDNPALHTLLSDGLADPSEDVAVAAAEALESIGDRSCLGELYRAMGTGGRVGEAAADAVAAILAKLGPNRQDDLSLIVGTSWPEEGAVARNLCRVVGQLASSRYAPHLVSMLGSSDVGVRIAAAHGLGRLEGEHEGASALAFTLADEEPQVRAAACRSLGMLGAPRSVQSLLTATSDDSALVRAAAVQALVEIDNPVALARLRAIVTEDPVPTVVVHAIAGLGSSRLDQDLTMLMSLCTSEDREVIKAAARALERFDSHRATAALLGLLGHERWDVRWTAGEVLGKRRDATAVEPMRRALSDEHDRLVREVLGAAIEAVERGR